MAPNNLLLKYTRHTYFQQQLAFEKLGVPADKRQTIFRYDDTNPEAESDEYIQSLRYIGIDK
jgi:glutaminyl-tRNA synthetase